MAASRDVQSVNLIRIACVACIVIVCLSVTSSEATAAKFNRVVEIGQKAPKWTGLRGTDGREHSIKDYAKAKALIVVFTCNHCPYAKLYEDRLIQIATENAKRKVQVVAISVSLSPTDNLDAMRKRATEKKYPFDYLHDPTQGVAKSYGALWTPQVFLLNQEREFVYMGKIDDSPDADDVTEHFLADAIDAVVTGRTPEVSETKAVGCPIIYE